MKEGPLKGQSLPMFIYFCICINAMIPGKSPVCTNHRDVPKVPPATKGDILNLLNGAHGW